jgi:hypothetical protein
MKKNKVVAVGHGIGFIKLFMGCRSDKEQGSDDEEEEQVVAAAMTSPLLSYIREE